MKGQLELSTITTSYVCSNSKELYGQKWDVLEFKVKLKIKEKKYEVASSSQSHLKNLVVNDKNNKKLRENDELSY